MQIQYVKQRISIAIKFRHTLSIITPSALPKTSRGDYDVFLYGDMTAGNSSIRRIVDLDRYICLTCKIMNIQRSFDDRSLYCTGCGDFDYFDDVREVRLVDVKTQATPSRLAR